ncbi:MAG: peptidase M13 [Verrucomicrobia bacterium]|nr:MAG: peptidase M13 [Verrucomicrobiota bacterium]
MKLPFHLAAAATTILLAASVMAQSDTSTSAPRFGTWGFDLSGKDGSVKPGDDFFKFANGGYLERTRIPEDLVRFGNFDVLTILSENRVHEILDEALRQPTEATAKISGFYAAFMDEAKVEQLGAQPLAAELAKVKAAASREQLAAMMGNPASMCRSLFGPGISADAKDPSRYAVYIGSGGLGMPDKDYYLKPAFAETKAKYLTYVKDLLELIGWDSPSAAASQIVAFETRLAEASWERAELRDRDKTYNPMTPAELAAYAPGFDFAGLLDSRGLAKLPKLIVDDNTAFPKKSAIFAATPLATLQAWMAFGIADTAAPYLSKALVAANFGFHAKTLSGQPAQRARWKRGVMLVNEALGEAVGQIYVARYFPAASKRQMLELVNNVRTVLAERINRLDWMGEATKMAAQQKLASFTVKIGYPDEWRDYSKLVVVPDDLYGNLIRSGQFSWQRELDRLDKPVDRKEWGMPPQKVNAYYNPSFNEIVFPAAILQPPFFDPQADPAVNYGGIGGVIAHEISHGFDDQGRKSNGDGVLKDWWTSADSDNFNARAERLGSQYESIEIMPGEHINGKLTMGENIGDMGGLTLALDAYQASLHGAPAPVLDGVTGVQRVFFGWAQVWRQKSRDEALRKQIHTDPHSPAAARVNGVLRNIDAWYSAFNVQPGDKLYVKPADRVHIW